MVEPAEKELGSVEIPFAEVLRAPGRLLQQEYMLQGRNNFMSVSGSVVCTATARRQNVCVMEH